MPATLAHVAGPAGVRTERAALRFPLSREQVDERLATAVRWLASFNNAALDHGPLHVAVTSAPGPVELAERVGPMVYMDVTEPAQRADLEPLPSTYARPLEATRFRTGAPQTSPTALVPQQGAAARQE